MITMNDALTIAILTATAWLVSEIAKISLSSIKLKSFDVLAFFRYGGMPSAHSALVTGIATSVFIVQGFTPLFVVCVAIAALIIRDVSVIRGTIDKLSGAKKGSRIIPIAHSSKEIFVGVIIGLVVPYIVSLFL